MGRMAIEQVVVRTLIDHIKSLSFERSDGTALTINKVHDKFPTREEEVNPPAISVIAGTTVYEGELTPRVLPESYNKVKKTALIKRGDVTVPVQIDCFATLPVERSEIMRGLEQAFLGADFNGYLKLPAGSDYFDRLIAFYFDSAQGSFETEQSAEDGIRRTVLLGEAYTEYVEEKSVALAAIEAPVSIVEVIT